MLRTFDAHDIREMKELGGIWKMQKLSAENGILQTVFVTVPSCWESIRGFSEVKWTEDRQAAIIKELLGKLCCNPDNVGVILWQFSDCRVDDGFFAQRPNTRNNKGIVDVYRQPKLSYYTVCEQFKKIETYKGGTNNGKSNGN